MNKKIKIKSQIQKLTKTFLKPLQKNKNKIEKKVFGTLPQLFLELMTKYFRLEIEGLEHIPQRGQVILAPNHSGFAGLDAMILSYQVLKSTGRQPRILTHRLWFVAKTTAWPAQKLGFIKASLENGLNILKKKQSLIVFPEGEEGNFKPSTKAYHLQEFKRGFVRMALSTQSPIIPTLILGAEETHINLRQIQLPDFLQGLILPLPLNFIPLPAKWRIIFLPPIQLPYAADQAQNHELVSELAESIRKTMQEALVRALAQRGSVYF